MTAPGSNATRASRRYVVVGLTILAGLAGPMRGAAEEAAEARPEPDPIARVLAAWHDRLREAGVEHAAALSAFVQSADRPARDWTTLGTLTWQVAGDWTTFSDARLGDGHLAWHAYGSTGLGHDTGRTTMASEIGSVSVLNTVTQPDDAILNELYWRQAWADGRWWLAAGKIDFLNHVDTNRVANDGHTQFLAGPLENDPSIPAPPYGGFGAMLRGELHPGLSLGLGGGDSGVRAASAPWRSADDGSWWQLADLSVDVGLGGLGAGTCRLLGWHNRLRGRAGWGGSLAADHDLGVPGLVGFLRVGVGDPDVAPVRAFVSGGAELTGLPRRQRDVLRLGAAWSEAGRGASGAETLVEAQWEFSLLPWLSLAPDVQVVVDPVANRRDSAVAVLGLRLTSTWPPRRPHDVGIARRTTL